MSEYCSRASVTHRCPSTPRFIYEYKVQPFVSWRELRAFVSNQESNQLSKPAMYGPVGAAVKYLTWKTGIVCFDAALPRSNSKAFRLVSMHLHSFSMGR
eukprot:COSAG05_NODE_435_length_9845_cov_24.433364_1_plen_99_part_00